jgi:hypothetical protein|tara:strand:- start:902 stop:1093 length:192 start_codon:yes stop_codon:yes gene_type:complete
MLGGKVMISKTTLLELRQFLEEEDKLDLIDILINFISEEYLYSILGMYKTGYTVDQIKNAEVY